jgi:hypothetical protein
VKPETVADLALLEVLGAAAARLDADGFGHPDPDGGLSSRARRVAAWARRKLGDLLNNVVEIDPNDAASMGEDE